MKTTTAKRPRGRGFSLLEMLLVLVVIGMIVTMAGLSVSSGSRPYEIDAAARNFADIAQYALDESQLRGVDMGARLELDPAAEGLVFTYEWLERVGNVWQTANFDPEAYGRRSLPVNVEVILELENEETELTEPPRDADERVAPAPQVVFFASGETTPGIMSWLDAETGDLLWELEWDLVGRFDLRRRGLENEDDDDFE